MDIIYLLRTAGLAFGVVVIIAPLIIKKLALLKFGQKILEDGPTWHKKKQNTPTMGGVIFIFSMIVTLLSFLPSILERGNYLPLLMLALSLIFGGIGMIDDWTKIRKKRNKGITAWQKLMLQIAAAALFITVMRYFGYLSQEMRIPFTDITLVLHWAIYLAIAIFIIIGTDNAVNITDGIDGLCSSVTLIIAIFFSILFGRTGNGGELFALTLAGALAGFFLFNKNPARVFMGDTGSLFLGGAVCAMAFATDMPLILVVIGLVYVIETLSDIIQILYYKATGGKRVFKMAPIHHHLELSDWSEWKIVIVACMITAFMCALSLFA